MKAGGSAEAGAVRFRPADFSSKPASVRSGRPEEEGWILRLLIA
jgi:hypothetical protein